jgi:hypothetical protein
VTIRVGPDELSSWWQRMTTDDPPFLLGLPLRPDPAHRPPPAPVATALRTLACADHHLDIRFTGPASRPVVGLGGAHGNDGVIAVRPDAAGPIELLRMDASRVAATLVGLLGPVRPAVAPEVNIPAEVLDQACAAAGDGDPWTGSPWILSDQLVVLGVPRRDATALARMLSGIDFGGQLGITDRRGRGEVRGPWVIGFVRNPEQRYAVLVRRAGTVTVSPTDAARLLRHWGELVDHPGPALSHPGAGHRAK